MVVLSISRFQICSAHTQRATQNRCKFHKLNGKRARRCAHTRCSFEPLWRCLLLLSWNCQPSRVHALIKWHQLCPLARSYIHSSASGSERRRERTHKSSLCRSTHTVSRRRFLQRTNALVSLNYLERWKRRGWDPIFFAHAARGVNFLSSVLVLIPRDEDSRADEIKRF